MPSAAIGLLVLLAPFPAQCAESVMMRDRVAPPPVDQPPAPVESFPRGADAARTPASLRVIQGEQVREEGRLHFDELLGSLAGVTRQSDGNGGSVFHLRGASIGPPVHSPTAARSGAPLIIDGILNSRADALQGASIDMERIEILRGAQAAAAGAAGTGLVGGLHVFSIAPDLDRLSVSAHAELGNFALRRVEGVLNLPIGSDQALRLAVADSRRDGFVSSGSGEVDMQYVRARYRWRRSEDLDMTLTASLQHNTGNAVEEGGLLYTGSFVPLGSDTPTFSPGAGQSYAPGAIMQRDPVRYTFAAGSVLGPGLAPLATTTTLSIQPRCSPVGLPSQLSPFTSGKDPTAPFVAVRNCPANWIAVRDNVNFAERRNPWDDGFQPANWAQEPARDAQISSVSAEIHVSTAIGELLMLPAYQHASERRLAPGPSTQSSAGTQDAWQFEAQLSSATESRVSWRGGVLLRQSSGLEDAVTRLAAPDQRPPALAAGQFSTDGVDPVTGQRTLRGNCYLFGADLCEQLVRDRTEDRTGELTLHGDIVVPVTPRLRAVGGVQWQRLRQRYGRVVAETGGNRIIATDPLAVGGFVFSSPTAGTDCATASGADACRVEFFPADFATFPRESIVRDWNGQVSVRTADGSILRAPSQAAASQYRLGGEFDISDELMAYLVLNSASRPGEIGGAPDYQIPDPLRLHQLTVGLEGRWFNGRLEANFEIFDLKVSNQPAAPLIDLNYAITTAGGTSFRCPELPGVAATARLGPLRTNADTCFNAPLTNAVTADVRSRGLDIELRFHPTDADRIEIAAEWLPQSELAGVRGLRDIGVAEVLAAAAANSANPGTGAARDLQVTAAAIVSGFNAQNFALQFGGIVPQSPKRSLDASWSHEFRLPGGSRLVPRVNFSSKSAYWIAGGGPLGTAAAIRSATNAINSGRFWPNVQPDYNMWNLFVGWRAASGRWRIDAYATNLTREPLLLQPGAQTTTTSIPGAVVVTGGGLLSALRASSECRSRRSSKIAGGFPDCHQHFIIPARALAVLSAQTHRASHNPAHRWRPGSRQPAAAASCSRYVSTLLS
jgi:hypothetical protein